MESGRLGKTGNTPRLAIGSQGCGQGDGEFNLAGEGACRVYWAMELRQGFSIAETKELEVSRAGWSRGEGMKP